MKSWGLHTFSPDTRDMMGNWSEDGGLEIVVLSLAWCGRSQTRGPAGKFEARGFSKFVCGHVAGLLGLSCGTHFKPLQRLAQWVVRAIGPSALQRRPGLDHGLWLQRKHHTALEYIYNASASSDTIGLGY